MTDEGLKGTVNFPTYSELFKRYEKTRADAIQTARGNSYDHDIPFSWEQIASHCFDAGYEFACALTKELNQLLRSKGAL